AGSYNCRRPAGGVNGGPAGRARRDLATWFKPVKRLEAEGGEALADDGRNGDAGDGGWCVAWTRSQCEQQVHDQLAGKGFRPFLPRVNVWSRRGRFRCLSRAPMFPGYLFLPPPGDKGAFIEVRKARGLVALLGPAWDRPALVPSRDIEAIRRLSESSQPALPPPYLKEGAQVYDDNIFYSASSPQADRIARITPALALGYHGARLSASGRYGFDAESFSEHPEMSDSMMRQRAGLDLAFEPARSWSASLTG